ncbi:fec operon regulator FecR [Sphingobacterium spiritivorum]|uniref:Fec operon regulator FecR n=1 Tax=Sphingobacterium spiritivorum TaxID=258 RepID=A0A380CK96_SPHSI|nr:FecR family protein [Sphingobacterium spiritivorum]SUJ21111.1 fec operon regulator FecR [Sphingobacterium spiritivorum]
MDNCRFRYLYEQYLIGRLSAEELEEWKVGLSQPDLDEELEILVKDLWNRDDLSTPKYDKEKALHIYNEIIGDSNEEAKPIKAKAKEKRVTKLWSSIAAAVALFGVVLGIGGVFLSKNNTDARKSISYVQDIAPGKTGATLTLANGKKIRLANAVNGEIAEESGISVSKTAEGNLVYEVGTSSEEGLKKGGMNTLSTARGETYILILPDKSKVWLNAASSLTYAADLLDRGIRRVQLQGEAYFEISKDKQHPFVVSTANHDIEVLGTHFNVSSYPDESSTTTTLLEGSVKTIKGELTRVLKPNQQSVFTQGNFSIKNVNAEDAIAWKDGTFLFEDETLQSIMRRISRWYNVEVEYADNVDKNKLYGGGLSRYENVSSVLKILESTKKIHFKIEGRRILVMK